jgi:hypothetical protein
VRGAQHQLENQVVARCSWFSSRGSRPIRCIGITAIAAGLFVYVAVRAALVPITHDEAFSYLVYVSRSFEAILALKGPELANNHVLNSLLARTATVVFGPSELALRLPNLLAFGLYLVSAIALARRFTNVLGSLCGFALLVGNPLLLELFGLERGYGLGLAFLLSCAELFLRAEEENPFGRSTAILIGSLCGVLAVLSNLVFLIPFAALLFVHTLRRPPRTWPARLALFLPVLGLAAMAGPRIAVLQSERQFYFGGPTGFWADTVGSLARYSIVGVGDDPSVQRLVEVSVAALLALGGLTFLSTPARRRSPVAAFALSVLLLAGVASSIQHRLLGTPFLLDRTAIFFVPFMALAVAGTCDMLLGSDFGGIRRAGGVLALLLTVAALTNLVRSANLEYSSLWRYDADAKRAIADLKVLHDGGAGRLHIGGSWIFEPSLNFYRTTRGLTWLDPIERHEDVDRCNVLYVAAEDASLAPSGQFVEVRRYALSRNRLLRRILPAGSTSRKENPELMGSLDEPAPGGRVSGDLSVRGWARIPGEDLAVRILIDGTPRRASHLVRVGRPDVAAVLPQLGDCASAGYEAVFSFMARDEGRHEIDVIFEHGEAQERHYPSRQFNWLPLAR